MPTASSATREWVVLQRSMADLIDDNPNAVISVALDLESGKICGMDVGEDSGESLAQALSARAPGTESIPDPDSILAPADLLALVRLQMGRFADPPSVALLPQGLAAQAELAIDSLLDMLRGAAPLGEVHPADWEQLVAAAWGFLQRHCWDSLGETPLVLRMTMDGTPVTWIAVAMGEMGTSYGLVMFTSVADYRRFMSTDADDEAAEGDFPAGTIVFTLSAEPELEGMRPVAVSMGWPESEPSLPLVMRCTGRGERVWDTSDVRIATVALTAVVEFVSSRDDAIACRHQLADGGVAICEVSLQPEVDAQPKPAAKPRKRSPTGGRKRS